MSVFSDLDPRFRPWARWLYKTAETYGLRPRVTSTYRSLSEQRRLYNLYLRGQHPLPVAPPGASLHNYGLAFDMVSANQEWLGVVWEAVGGRWGGRFRDPVHFSV